MIFCQWFKYFKYIFGTHHMVDSNTSLKHLCFRLTKEPRSRNGYGPDQQKAMHKPALDCVPDVLKRLKIVDFIDVLTLKTPANISCLFQ